MKTLLAIALTAMFTCSFALPTPGCHDCKDKSGRCTSKCVCASNTKHHCNCPHKAKNVDA